MKLTIEIDMDGAAFEDNGNETAWILRRLCSAIEDSDLGPDVVTGGPTLDVLRDSNGNVCGKVTVTP